MAAESKPEIEIFDSPGSKLGAGSFGAVYRARLNDLPCAAKILHHLLLETSDPGRHTILQRFYQECELMKTIAHPNIVQYLYLTNDPKSDLPVLLMELLEENLTQYLDRIGKPPPYHTQVNLSHDVALAVAHLHFKGIIHRDLSSNNVLLTVGLKAKVSDFGMSKILDFHETFSQRSITPLPGTQVVMPPETLFEPPHYSNKIDCFSFGPLLIQLMTAKFPDPGQRFTMKTDISSPVGISQVPVLEEERRKNHIALIPSSHPLLPIARQCLKYRPEERPTAHQLCIQIAQLKKEGQYSESITDHSPTENQSEIEERLTAKQKKLESLQQHLHGETQHKEEIIEQLKGKHDELIKKEAEVRELTIKLDRKTAELSIRENDCQQFQESLAITANTIQEKELRIRNLTEKLREAEHQLEKLQMVGDKAPLDSTVTLSWKKRAKAPCKMHRGSTAVDENVVYFKSGQNNDIYRYNIQQETWQRLPGCPRFGFALVLIKGTLTTVGGTDVNAKETNTLFNFTPGKWTEKYPPMPTKRTNTTTAVTEELLIVIGGVVDGKQQIPTVELLDIAQNRWYKACNLPQIMYQPSATICNNNIYLTGWKDSQNQPSTEVFSASLATLKEYSIEAGWFSSLTGSKREPTNPIWEPLPALSVIDSTCVTINGNQLLAIGGEDIETKVYTNSIYQYNTEKKTWIKISEIGRGRSSPLVAVVPTANQLIVVGGFTGVGLFTNAIDIGLYH